MEKNFKEDKDLIKEEVNEMSDSELGRESQKIQHEAEIEEVGKELLESKRDEFYDHVQVKSEPIEADASEEDILPISYCEIGESDIQVKSEEFEYNSNQTNDYCDVIVHGEDNSRAYPQKELSKSYCQKVKDKKRCRKAVTLGTKLEVLRRIEAGEKIVQICKTMGLAKSTIQTIRDKKEDIKSYMQSAAPLNASRLTRQRNWIMEEMEKVLIMWIEDNNNQKIPMSVMTIQEKALRIFENLKNADTDESAEDVTFQASRGWFEKFKNRFHLINFKVKGEAVTSKEYSNMSRVIERDGYKPDQVLKVDKTGNQMPVESKQLSSKHLSDAFSYFEQGIKILLENDPDVERSAQVSREIFSAISCYKSLKNEIDKEVGQTTLNNFVKPANNEDGSDMQDLGHSK